MYGEKYYLGIDIGSVSIAIALIDNRCNVIKSSYTFHQGQITEKLIELLKDYDLNQISSIGATSSTPDIIRECFYSDSRVSYITAAKHLNKNLPALLIVGAEKFGLVSFTKNGEYRSYKSNTSCAAGTGSFLDQQAQRLKLQSIEHFSQLAYQNNGNFPLIASRCAVFAKTDLIHAQQEGYTLAEICDGLSYGLAKNIVDTLFVNSELEHVIAAGGVSLNKAVIKHIEKLANIKITVDNYANFYGAIGAAFNSIGQVNLSYNKVEDLIITEKKEKKIYFSKLELQLSQYPDFNSLNKYKFYSEVFKNVNPVEIDIYKSITISKELKVYLGIDIGSTSTKAVLIDQKKDIILGLYTTTSGQPIRAIQVILESINNIQNNHNVKIEFLGVGTTGSGRKFIGKIVGADIMLDEITAHARAACYLDPETDTIIEIGGQDSKFTTLQNGSVTFSVMNNICAAGTGSFIEEQARKLGCSLADYQKRTENVEAPMISDRCTVFMERDMNHFLSEGYEVDEILASVLHSIRDNYLSKVAIQGQIGKKIFFQGATAKNKSLIAAFEQKLQKPIMVSPYCHLTGAMGVALEMIDTNQTQTQFRGLNIYKNQISLRTETCTICNNNCKLKIAEVNGETEAFGFLCGRDYNTQKYIKNKKNGFELITGRNEIYKLKTSAKNSTTKIGLLAGLHLFEELPFWKKFFDLLNIQIISSENHSNALKEGKNLAEAEFCAPISALHGHVNYLMDKVDYIFLPVYLDESKSSKENKQYCYYTQFVSSVISVHKKLGSENRILTPLLKSQQREIYSKFELHKMFKSANIKDISFLQVSRAYDKAKKHFNSLQIKWKEKYLTEIKNSNNFHVILLGRPYTVLAPSMNNHIPDIIEKNGIMTFYMDQLPDKQIENSKSEEIINNIKWKFASSILHATEIVAKSDNSYPVLITSFKCTPDSFVIEYFKEILNKHKKPYLILQLDEHDSAVGYETRIEAGIRSFKNHFERKKKQSHSTISDNNEELKNNENQNVDNIQSDDYIRSLMKDATETLKSYSIDLKKFNNLLQRNKIKETEYSGTIINGINKIKNKTFLLPSWDPCVGPLLEALLINTGIDARLVNNTDDSIQRSLVNNTGQCIPLNIIVQNAIDYIERNDLDPSNTVLWSIDTNLSCNFNMFPHYTKKLLANYGKGLEKTNVYMGDLVFYDLSLQTSINAYLAYMFGGFIRKIGCQIRPYEIISGTTNKIMDKSFTLLYNVFKTGKSKDKALEKIISDFESVEISKTKKPKVAIFGDLYVRDNDLVNQDLIKTIEKNGGEAITTPFSEYLKIIAEPITKRSLKEGRYLDYARNRFLASIIPLVEDKFNKIIFKIIDKPPKIYKENIEQWIDKFGLNLLQTGESFDNILKIHSLIHHYPDISLFIQTNPSFCCPSIVTDAMRTRIEEMTGIPVVSIEYDGTSGFKNEVIIPYLKCRT